MATCLLYAFGIRRSRPPRCVPDPVPVAALQPRTCRALVSAPPPALQPCIPVKGEKPADWCSMHRLYPVVGWLLVLAANRDTVFALLAGGDRGWMQDQHDAGLSSATNPSRQRLSNRHKPEMQPQLAGRSCCNESSTFAHVSIVFATTQTGKHGHAKANITGERFATGLVAATIGCGCVQSNATRAASSAAPCSLRSARHLRGLKAHGYFPHVA